ncbi:hypothetical protein BT69DRAFT_611035 [Atractiella rhizophila]|nr:hypothetical protein BT69DRAFT_611035 [Atractiella rhizophila]
MATVNIRRDVSDKFYRYKMPVLQIKIEGKGNGIKTVIPNMSDIARSLSRPATYPTKFFGCELGAQTTFDIAADRYIVNGAHQADRLRELLDAFIDKFVLCPSCKNPETTLVIGKDEMITRDCQACGHKGSVDMRHKLTTFILKNPPSTGGGTKGKGGKKKKDISGAADGIGGAAGDKTPPEEEEVQAGDGDEQKETIAGKEVNIPTLAEIQKEHGKGLDEDWDESADVSERVKELENTFKNSLGMNGDDEEGEGEDSPYKIFGDWVKDNIKEGDVEIFKKAKEMGIEKKNKTLTVLAQVLFSEDAAKEVGEHAGLLKKMTTSEKHQKSLLGGLERFIGLQHPEWLTDGDKTVQNILMKLYQADVLEEEVLLHWGTHVSKKYVDKETSAKVKKQAKNFIHWLEQADEEDSE